LKRRRRKRRKMKIKNPKKNNVWLPNKTIHNYLVDMIIPTMNENNRLPRTLLALSRQTLYQKGFLRIIIADYDPTGAQSESTKEVVYGLNLPNISVVNVDQPGIGYARNAGAYAGRSPYIVTFDADSTLNTVNALEMLLAPLIQQNSSVLLTHGDVTYGPGRLDPSGIETLTAMIVTSASRTLPIATNTAMYPRDKFMQIGGYRNVNPEDWDFIFRFCVTFGVLCKMYVKGVITIMSDRRAVQFANLGAGIFDYTKNFR
jgi:glycosyltransferase involved in cell wall biosynthesis